MDKVYEAVKKILDKHCKQQSEVTCSGSRRVMDITHIRDICWLCKHNQSLALLITKEIHDSCG